MKQYKFQILIEDEYNLLKDSELKDEIFDLLYANLGMKVTDLQIEQVGFAYKDDG